MQMQFRRLMGAALAVVATSMAAIAVPALAQEITVPEKLLFLSKHFEDTKESKLTYTYRHEGEDPEAFSDEVSLDILQHHPDGTVSVTAHFLTGPRLLSLPTLEQAEGNPVILGFLERDIQQMKRVTGGSTGYFRRRIRLALAAPDLPVTDIKVKYDGREVAAQKITIHPYEKDPLRERFGKYADKAYIFVLSDAVPGSLYSMYTTIRDANTPETVDTSLTITGGETAK
jgi:hypothetical protein